MKVPKREYISKEMRRKVREKCGGRCAYCGDELKRMFIDHLVPHQMTQDDSFGNLMPSCHKCNNYKMTFSLEQFRKEIECSVSKARRYSVNYRFAEKYNLVKATGLSVKFYFEYGDTWIQLNKISHI